MRYASRSGNKDPQVRELQADAVWMRAAIERCETRR
jgi:hypothetical protein